MKKNKLFALLLIFFISSFSLRAQISVDPLNNFYTDVIGWYLKGYIDSLPQLKPYPLNIIEDILQKVCEVEEEEEAQKAQFYYEKYFNKKWHINAEVDFNARVYSLSDTENDNAKVYEDNELVTGYTSFSGDYAFSDFLGIGYHLGVKGQNDNEDFRNILPTLTQDVRIETVESLTFDAGDVDFLIDTAENISFGSKSLYGTLGYNKTGFGIFPDSDLVINPNAFEMVNASFNYVSDFFEYTEMFALPTARDKTDVDEFTFGKYMFFHSLRVPIIKNKLSVSYYESVVFGNNFMASYIMPVPYIIIANVSGFNENVLAGLKLEWKPVQCFAWSMDFLVDDFKPKKLLKLKLDEAALRGAVKFGFVYVPLDSVASFISLDYTLVSPYTYTKYDQLDETYDYNDYTNLGKNIGTELEPNSDRIKFRITFNPFKKIRITTSTVYARHANQYEDLDDEEVIELSKRTDGKEISDGSLYQNTQNLDSAIDNTAFLTQSNVMYLMQSSLDFEFELKAVKTTYVGLNLGYTFEYIKNDGVTNPIFTGTYSTVEEVQKARDSWEDNLHDSYKHYFRAGVVINF